MKKKLNFILCICLSLMLGVMFFAGCDNKTPDDGGETESKCGLTISESSITLNVGTDKQLTASTNDNSKYTFIWSSSNDSIASVSDGRVTAVSAGTATITVGCRAKGSATVLERKTCAVTVISHKVNLSKRAALIDVNTENTVTIEADVEGGNDPIVWTSSDESVATVADGVITGHKTGTATITATSGDVFADCRITVVNKKVVASGGTLNLDSSLTSPAWSSDDTTVATVANGVVTAVGAGTATITATSDAVTEDFIVTVTDSTDSYTLESGKKADAANNPGVWNYLLESTTAKVSDIPTYDRGVLTMDITDIGESGANFAYLRYQPDNAGGKFYKVHLYIWASADGVIAINGVDTDIAKGASTRVIEYTSKKPSAADTFQFKFRTAASYIIAPYFEESAPETKLTLDKTELELLTEAGSNTATITPTYEAGATFEWSSSDESVATVDNGVVTAVGEGTATITCTSGGKSATCTVTVKSKSVTLSETFVTIYNTTGTHTITATASDDTAISWASSDSGIVTVDGGVLTGVAEGWATVTATSASGASRACVVFVTAKESSYTLVEGKNGDMKDKPGAWCWSSKGNGTQYADGVLTKEFTEDTALTGNNTFMLRFMPPEAGTWKITFTLKVTGYTGTDIIKTECKGTGGTQEWNDAAALANGAEIVNTFTASDASGVFFQLKLSGFTANAGTTIEVSNISFVKTA